MARHIQNEGWNAIYDLDILERELNGIVIWFNTFSNNFVISSIDNFGELIFFNQFIFE